MQKLSPYDFEIEPKQKIVFIIILSIISIFIIAVYRQLIPTARQLIMTCNERDFIPSETGDFRIFAHEI